MKGLIAKILAGLNGFFHTPVLTELFIAMLPIVELRGAIPIGVESGLPIWLAALIGFVGSSIPAPIILLALVPILNALKKTRWFKKLATWIENKFRHKSDKLENRAEKESEIAALQDDAVIPAATQGQNAAGKGTAKVVSGRAGVQVVPAETLEKKPQEVKPTDEEIKLKKRKERIKLLGIYTFVAIPLPFTGVWTGSAVAAFLGIPFFKALAAIVLGNLTAALIITLVTYLFKDYLWAVILILFAIIVLIIVGFIILQIFKKTIRDKKKKIGTAADIAAENVTAENVTASAATGVNVIPEVLTTGIASASENESENVTAETLDTASESAKKPKINKPAKSTVSAAKKDTNSKRKKD